MALSGEKARFSVRRLTRKDANAAAALYRAAGRDTAWADGRGIAAACARGLLCGGFAPGLTLCGGLCGAGLFPALREAAEKTQLLPRGARLLLPPAGAPDDGGLFFQILVAKAAAHGGPVWMPVPVRTGGAMLENCFAAGFVLRAVRPLHELRPHYFFECGGLEVKTAPECSIMVPVSDTLTLSRLLEDGLRGVGLRALQGGPAVCLTDEEKGVRQDESGNSGELCAAGRRSGLVEAARSGG